MPDSALARTGLTPLKNDGTDSTTIYRQNLRAIAALLEASGLLGTQGLDADRPAPGVPRRFYKPTDVAGVIYYDTGTAWEVIASTGGVVDGAANVGSLRTLGAGPQQAAAGPHGHSFEAILGGPDYMIHVLMGSL